jgi:acyl carrier protein
MNKDRVFKVVAEELAIPIERVSEGCRLEDLGADSLDMIHLALALEDEFNVAIGDDEARSFETVGDIIEYIDKFSPPALEVAKR